MPNQQSILNKAKASIKNFTGAAANKDQTTIEPTGEEMDRLIEVLSSAIKMEVEAAVKAEFAKRDGQEQPEVNHSTVQTGAPDPEQYFAGNHDSKPQSGAPNADDYF